MWIVLLGTGLWFTLGSGFWQLRHPALIFKSTFGRLGAGGKGKSGGITPFQAVSTALASTVGVGNIAGVATAIAAGGPGAVFWMWVSALLGMMTKYAEVFLAVHFRKRDEKGRPFGGPMYYMEALGWRVPAVFFALMGLLCSFGVGNLTQVNTLADACRAAFGVPPILSGAVTLVAAGAVMLGGIKAIASAAGRIVPFMAALYTLLCAAALFVFRENILPALGAIFTEAFCPGAALGGAAGYTVARTVRLGVSRGIFSHEAGLGSAPLAHACAETDSAARQGMWGAAEVFIDTMVVCTATALVILSSGVYSPLSPAALDGAPLTLAAFESALGAAGGYLVTACVILFAFATVLGWSFYGRQCCKYLFKSENAAHAYLCVYIFLIMPGALMGMDVVWGLSDILNGLMALPNISAILALSGTVFSGLKKRRQSTVLPTGALPPNI